MRRDPRAVHGGTQRRCVHRAAHHRAIGMCRLAAALRLLTAACHRPRRDAWCCRRWSYPKTVVADENAGYDLGYKAGRFRTLIGLTAVADSPFCAGITVCRVFRCLGSRAMARVAAGGRGSISILCHEMRECAVDSNAAQRVAGVGRLRTSERAHRWYTRGLATLRSRRERIMQAARGASVRHRARRGVLRIRLSA